MVAMRSKWRLKRGGPAGAEVDPTGGVRVREIATQNPDGADFTGVSDGLNVLRGPIKRLRSPRRRTLFTYGVLGLALYALAMGIPVPYVAQSPGPTMDTLDSYDGKPMVDIRGAQVYPTEGDLRLTTVAVKGGPGYRLSAGRMLYAWLYPDTIVLPVEQYYPPSASKEEIKEHAQLEMSSSHVAAAVAALTEVGIAVPTTLTVTGITPGSAAEGIVAEGDVLESITVDEQATPIVDFATLTGVLAQTPPGTRIVLTVKRGGKTEELTFATGSRHERDAAAGLPPGEEPDGSVLGLSLKPDAKLPVEVKYQIDDVGGPSAGLMFALATVDKLTPGALTGGQDIAGTGTISLDGTVGPIGGIRQKIVGAAEDGSHYFLAPDANCAELSGRVPEGMTAFPVRNLRQAREIVETVASDDAKAIAALPTCG